MSDAAKKRAGGGFPDGMTNSHEVARLYDQLHAAVRSNDKAAVEKACQALLQAGCPFSELLGHAGRGTQALHAVHPSPYYWSAQWSVHPDLAEQVKNRIARPSIAQGSGTPNLEPPKAALPAPQIPALELPTASRRDLVEEWQARQRGRHSPPQPNPLTSEQEKTPEALPGKASVLVDRNPGISEIDEEVVEYPHRSPAQSVGRGQPSRAMLLPIVGLYLGGAAVVSSGLYLLVQIGGGYFAAAPPSAPARTSTTNLEATSTTRAPSEGSPASRPSTAITAGVPTHGGAAGQDQPVEAVSLPKTSAGTDVSEGEPRAASSGPNETANSSRSDQDLPAPASLPAIHVPRTPDSELQERLEAPPSALANDAGAQPPVDIAPHRQKDTSATSSGAVSTVPNDAVLSTNSQDLPPRGTQKKTEPTTSDVVSKPIAPSIDTSTFLSRGDALLGMGDIASARLFYERSADAGNAQAAIRLGETFDPSFLAHARLGGVRGDPAMALKWYKRARDLGATEAGVLVMSIEGK